MDLKAWFHPRRELVDGALGSLFADAEPAAFIESLHYALLGGGKRIRPAIAIAAYDAVAGGAGDTTLVLPAAVSVELIHGYSLVHDDLPAMDDDDERRGRPTVHIAWDEATAILVGDSLLTEAFAVLARGPWSDQVRVALIRELSRAAGYRGMVGGQVADIRATPEITEDALSRLHACKTGALIRAAAVMGGVVAGADEEESRALEQYGTAIGMAFQLADDLLDSEEDAADDGPPSYVKLVGFEETQRRAHFFSQQAIDAVLHLPDPEVLVALAQFTVRRRE
jgi:geranylgeranyl diphosphate synthase type II